MSQTEPLPMEDYASECEQPEVLACLAMAEWVRRLFAKSTPNGYEATEKEAAIFQASIDLLEAVQPDHPAMKRRSEDMQELIAQMKEMADSDFPSGQDSPQGL